MKHHKDCKSSFNPRLLFMFTFCAKYWIRHKFYFSIGRGTHYLIGDILTDRFHTITNCFSYNILNKTRIFSQRFTTSAANVLFGTRSVLDFFILILSSAALLKLRKEKSILHEKSTKKKEGYWKRISLILKGYEILLSKVRGIKQCVMIYIF